MFCLETLNPNSLLTRVKRRKRWLRSPGADRTLDQDGTEQQQSPPARRRILNGRRRSDESSQSETEESAAHCPDPPVPMRTSETESYSDSSPRTLEEARTADQNLNSLSSVLARLEDLEHREMEKMTRDQGPAPLTYWDTSDEEAFSDSSRSGGEHQTMDQIKPRTMSESVLTPDRTSPLEKTSVPERKHSCQFPDNRPFKHSTPLRGSRSQELEQGRIHSNLSGAEGNLEVFSLDSLEITELDSFRSTQLILTGEGSTH